MASVSSCSVNDPRRPDRSVKPRLPRHRPGERFLKGPIPWDWIERAAQQPGRAFHVGMAIWLWAGMKRGATVPLSIRNLATMGISRHAAYRALAALERADLVSVARHPGRKPIVTILPIRSDR